jgi:hypothetical protein
VRSTTPVENVRESASSSDTGAVPISKSFAPDPTTTGWTSRRSSSTRPSSSSDRTSVALPDIPMFLPRFAFSSVTALATSSSSRVELCHSSVSSVVETTYFGVAFMGPAIGLSAAASVGQYAAHSS